MKKIKNYIAIAACSIVLASCSVSGPLMITNNPVGTKVGVAERKIILGIAFGHTDLSIHKAAQNGGIKKVASVDWKVKGGLISTTYQTIVTGE